jgi:hypothetical protein
MTSQRERAFGRRGRFRGLSFAVAWFCLGVQAVGIAHLAVVRHTTCLEHGELIHAGPSSPSKAAAATETGARLATAALPALTDGHDHCLACATRRAVVADRAVSSVAVGPEGASSAPALPTAPGGSGALFRLAPKTSPPA